MLCLTASVIVHMQLMSYTTGLPFDEKKKCSTVYIVLKAAVLLHLRMGSVIWHPSDPTRKVCLCTLRVDNGNRYQSIEDQHYGWGCLVHTPVKHAKGDWVIAKTVQTLPVRSI